MPNIGIKTNLEKLEKKLKDKRKLLDKLEENYWIRKKKLEFNIRQLDEEEKKYHEKKQFLDRKSVSSTTSISNQNANKDVNKNDDTLNDNSLDDLNMLFKSASLSDPINDQEADPSTSLNKYNERLKPIRPIMKSFPNVSGRSFNITWYEKFEWLEYSIKANKCFCFCCRFFYSMVFSTCQTIKNGITIDSNLKLQVNLPKDIDPE